MDILTPEAVNLIACHGWDENPPVSIHSDAIAAEEGAIQVAIISSAIALIHRQQDEAPLIRLNVFGGCVAYLVAARQETKTKRERTKISRFSMSIFDVSIFCVRAENVSLETHNKNQYKVCATLAAPAETFSITHADYYSYSGRVHDWESPESCVLPPNKRKRQKQTSTAF